MPSSDKGGSQPDNDVVPIIAVSLVAFAILASVVIFKVLPTGTPIATKSYAVCKTAACVEYAQDLSTTVNRSIDACHDFYSHVCSGWKHSESVNSDLHSRFSAEAVVALKSAAQATRAGAAQSAVQKAALLYQSCEKVYTEEDRSELDRFRPMLKDVGVHWPNSNPNPDVLRTLLRLISQMALPVLFSAEARTGTNDQILRALFDAFNDNGSSASVDYDTFQKLEKEGLAAFALALERANGSDNIDYVPSPAPLWIGLDGLAMATPDISKQRWETQLREQNILASPSNATFAVSAPATAVLGALSGLIKGRGEKGVELFVGWLVLQEVAPLVSKDFEAAGYVDAGHQQRCLALAEMLLGWAVLAPFAVSAASRAILPYIEARSRHNANVTVSIEKALHDAVTGSEWLRNLNVGELPNASTGSFLQKMAEFESLSQLDPAYAWMIDMVDHLSDNWNRSVRSRRAAPIALWRRVETRVYEASDGGPTSPVILSPSSFLTPAYVDGTGAAHRYGALGSLVAAHLFLLLTQRVLISTGGHDELSRRLACYTPTGDRWETGSEEAALGLAWKAYRSTATKDVRLEGLEQLSGDQLFFVAFAFLRCASPASQRDAEPESGIVNSAVRNVDGFAHSFNCSLGVPMNPEAKCSYF
ncbi:hypothetical protein MTO96_025716 [Rhipicephalus appendiculatus]